MSLLKKLTGTVLPLAVSACVLSACADAKDPSTRDPNIPAPKTALERKQAINERPDAVMYLPLGKDVLVPEATAGEPLPARMVGPFELRGETLAGALQLVLDGTDIPVAFETTEGLDRTITVTNLKGNLPDVVDQICSLADLYCSFEKGNLVVKDTQIFAVSIPPLVATDQMETLMGNIATALQEIVGAAPVTDESTRTIVYRATQRTSEMAERYFQRLRQSTALIIYETYIWEVSLDAGNSTGINWDKIDKVGGFNVGISLQGSTNPELGTPISIGIPTKGSIDLDAGDVLNFISDYGAVKTISQPQITVLSGSAARLRVADRQNYVASISRTVVDAQTTTSTTTDSVDSGFTFDIGSSWDNATVYGNVNILLQEVRGIDTFDDNPDAVVQLPQTTERELQTQVRVRPGNSLLIAGLVREVDNLTRSGPGVTLDTFLPTSRSATTKNVELVFLLRPRVIVFTQGDEAQPYTNMAAAMAKATPVVAPAAAIAPALVEAAPMPEMEPVPAPAPAPAPALPESSFTTEALEAEPVIEPAPVPAPAPAPAPAPVPVEIKAPAPQPVKAAPQPAAAAPTSVVPSVEVSPVVAPKAATAAANGDPSVIVDYGALN